MIFCLFKFALPSMGWYPDKLGFATGMVALGVYICVFASQAKSRRYHHGLWRSSLYRNSDC